MKQLSMRNYGLLALAALVGSLLVVSVAFAAVTPKPKLSFFNGGGATIGWTTVGGSGPHDTTGNIDSIQIDTLTSGVSFAGAYTWGKDEAANSIVGRSLAEVQRLGFDSKGYLGAGAPRISLITHDTNTNFDHTFFLAASYCNAGADPSAWVTSDFINDADCVIWGPNGANAGWSTVVANFPNDVVTDWFLIVDEAPATTYVDSLTVQDFGWVRSGANGIVKCQVNLGCTN